MPRYVLLATLAFGLAACDTVDERFQEQVVVEAYLAAGEPLPRIWLSKTSPIGRAYSFEEFAARGAVVTVALVGADGADEETYTLAELEPGIYGVEGDAPVVRPLRTYRFEARVPGFELPVRASTVTPDTFRVVRAPADTLRYQVGPSPEVAVSRSSYPGRQTFYIITIESLAPFDYDLTPIRALREDARREDFIIGASPILGADTYPVAPDGNLEVRIPWLSFSFFGPNRFTVHAIDDNLYDFVRTRSGQFSFGALSPGEIQNVLEYVENGTGFFGSFARASTQVYLIR
jgi:hypothetical protein